LQKIQRDEPYLISKYKLDNDQGVTVKLIEDTLSCATLLKDKYLNMIGINITHVTQLNIIKDRRNLLLRNYFQIHS